MVTTVTSSPRVVSTAPAVSTTGRALEPTKVRYEVPFTVVPSEPPDWEVAFFAAYGPAEQEVGSGAEVGKKYGPYEPVVLDRDGYWRVADVYKSRVARFDGNGEYMDSAPTPELMPMAGMVVMDSGELLAAASGNRIAVVTSNAVSLHSAEGAGNPTLMDTFEDSAFGIGSNGMAYQFSLAGDVLVVDRDVEYLRGRDGGRYRLGALDLKTLRLSLPDQHATIDLVPEPDDSTETEVVIGEAVRDRQGRTHVILYGTSLGSPTIQRGAYVRIDGTTLEVTAPMPDMFSGWGWSLLTNLTLDNDDNALITAVDPDGVRVWRYES